MKITYHVIDRNILQQRYSLSERDAGTQASYLLAGSMILYPVVSQFVLLCI